MSRRIQSALLVSLLLGFGGWVERSHAQNNNDACIAAFSAVQARDSTFQSAPPAGATNGCSLLATGLVGELIAQTQARQAAVDRKLDVSNLLPRAFQLPQSQVGSDVGSAAQGSAVTSTTPVELAGGNVSTIGTTQGTKALASVTLNPASLFGDTDGPLRDVIGRSEVGDLTILVPASTVNDGSNLTYLGLRARINHSALGAGSSRVKDADAHLAEVRDAFRKSLEQDAKISTEAATLLQTTSNVEGCALALYDLMNDPLGDSDPVEAACGGVPPSLSFDADAELDRAVARAVAEAQKAFFGTDVRYDWGDPALIGADSTTGHRLYGGLAFGRRLPYGNSGLLGLSLRVGGKYVDLTEINRTATAVEGGIDFAYQKNYGKQQLQVNGGIEGSYTDGSVDELDAAAQTDYVTFRAAVNVPLTSAYSLSINIAEPLAGSAESTFSVKLNWNLLFPGGE